MCNYAQAASKNNEANWAPNRGHEFVHRATCTMHNALVLRTCFFRFEAADPTSAAHQRRARGCRKIACVLPTSPQTSCGRDVGPTESWRKVQVRQRTAGMAWRSVGRMPIAAGKVEGCNIHTAVPLARAPCSLGGEIATRRSTNVVDRAFSRRPS